MQPALPASAPDGATVDAVVVVARWGPVLALAGLHAAVSVAWVAYNLYLGELLVRAGFPRTSRRSCSRSRASSAG